MISCAKMIITDRGEAIRRYIDRDHLQAYFSRAIVLSESIRRKR